MLISTFNVHVASKLEGFNNFSLPWYSEPVIIISISSKYLDQKISFILLEN